MFIYQLVLDGSSWSSDSGSDGSSRVRIRTCTGPSGRVFALACSDSSSVTGSSRTRRRIVATASRSSCRAKRIPMQCRGPHRTGRRRVRGVPHRRAGTVVAVHDTAVLGLTEPAFGAVRLGSVPPAPVAVDRPRCKREHDPGRDAVLAERDRLGRLPEKEWTGDTGGAPRRPPRSAQGTRAEVRGRRISVEWCDFGANAVLKRGAARETVQRVRQSERARLVAGEEERHRVID